MLWDSARPVGRWRGQCCSGRDRAKRMCLQVLTLRSSTSSVPSAVSRQPVQKFVTMSWHPMGRYSSTIDRLGMFMWDVVRLWGLEQR